MTDKDRSKAVEYNLPRMVKKRMLKRKRFGHPYIYALPGTNGRADYNIVHGLRCTDALIRFHLSKVGEYVSEREFRANRFNPVPEFAVIYDDVVLLFEYSTADNFGRKKMIGEKLKAYKNSLGKFKEEFEAEPYLVYVIDGHENEIERLASRHNKNNFYFTSADRFYSVADKKQLDAEIYIWRGERVSLYGDA
jgi:hypothetical protein